MVAVRAYQEWGRRLRKSDESAFRELFMDSYNPLMRYAKTFIRDEDAVRDILQEVYVHLWEIRLRIDEEKSLQALLYKMTRNRCLNHLGAKSPARLENLAPADQPTVEPDTGETDDDDGMALQRDLYQWIEELPDRQREAFELSRFEGLDHQEIAEVMECAPRTVNNHIVSALKTLRDRLQYSRTGHY